MAGLVRCTICGRRVSEQAAREIKGKACCPPCHQKLVAKLQQKKSAPPAPDQPAVRQPGTSGAKLINKVNAYQGRGLGQDPDMQGLPDIPAHLRDGHHGGNRGPGFELESLGGAAYCGILGCIVYGIYAYTDMSKPEKPGAVAMMLLALAALAGLPAAGIGLLESIKSSSHFRRGCSIVGLVMGVFLMVKAGGRFYDGVAKLPTADELVDAGIADPQKEAPEKAPTSSPEAAKPPKTTPEPPRKTGPLLSPAVAREQALRAALAKSVVEAGKAAAAADKRVGDLAKIKKTSLNRVDFNDDGTRVEGSLRIVRGIGSSEDVTFSAEVKDDKVKVVSFVLRRYAYKTDLTADAGWVVGEVESKDPKTRFDRGFRDLGLKTPCSATAGHQADNRILASYGKLVAKDKKPVAIRDGATGVIVALERELLLKQLLDLRKKSFPGAKPVALLMGNRTLLVLPGISTDVKPDAYKGIKIAVKPTAEPSKGAKYKFSWTMGSFTKELDTQGLRTLYNRMAEVKRAIARPGQQPLLLVLPESAPMQLTVTVLDACAKAGIPNGRLVLVISGSK